jgi:ABC-type antimicrobial peptide transport system permease subunit
MNPTMPVDISRLDAVIADSRPIRIRRFSTTMVGWLAGVATLLAAIGIYGVLASVVSQRRRDLGIRMALGATSRGVLGLVFADAFRLGALGLSFGVALAWGLSRFIQSQLYDVSATDATTLAAVGLLLATAVALASYIPARRASRIDPIQSLGE